MFNTFNVQKNTYVSKHLLNIALQTTIMLVIFPMGPVISPILIIVSTLTDVAQ